MSFFSHLPSPAFTPIGFNVAKAYASSTGSPVPVVLLLGLEYLSTIWRIDRFLLFTSAVSWAIIWVICSRVKPGLYSGNAAGRQTTYSVGGGGGWSGGAGGGGLLMLAGSLLLARVCDRASGVDSPWVKAGIPSAAYFIRVSGKVDNVSGLSVRGMRRIMMLVMIASATSLYPAFVSNSTLALGCCSAIFWALGLVLLEQRLADMDPGKPLGVLESWRNCALIGKELGMYLFIGFAGASLVFESFPLRVLSHMDVYKERDLKFAEARLLAFKLIGIGFLGAAKWVVVPFVIIGYTAITVGLLELAATLLFGIISELSGVRLAGTIIAFIGMSAYITARPGVDRAVVLPHLLRTRSAQLLIFFVLMAFALGIYTLPTNSNNESPIAPGITTTLGHPISKLIAEAEQYYKQMQERQSKSLSEAVLEYRRRYKMNPPPNFDKWYEYAKSRDSVLIDEYDTIYHSLKPFWGLPPQEIRKRAREAIGFNDPIGLHDNKLLHAAIRNGAVEIGGQGPGWQKDATQGMMQKFVTFLPDMDLGFNIHDEPRVVVPNDMVTQHLERARNMLSSMLNLNPITTKNEFTPLSNEERASVPDFPRTVFNVFAHQPTWGGARQSCPPDSPAKSVDLNVKDDMDRFSVQPLGFIANATEASNICLSPSLQRRHGFFDRPNAFNVAQQLLPVFSQSKVSSFNDILYPSPWYWAGKVQYDETRDIDWDQKNPNLYWRGSTTGGFSRNGGWKRQHRQRVVTVINKNDTAKILEKDNSGGWKVRETKRSSYSNLFDVRFSHVGQCDPMDCDAQREFFDIAPIADQNDAWQWKYLLDIDGNAFSGRYYAFLESNSAVFKLAVFREWHEEWIVPWVHFVPLSMELEEVVEAIRYFEEEDEGKVAIRKIAEEGRKWTKAVLRKEDLEVWFFRLLLEYGRVIDDNRETIGYLG